MLVPNLKVVDRHSDAEAVLTSYAKFLRTINRILLKRHSSILAKQANIFTTNVDMVFEVALEQMGIDFSDGFSGKIRPRFDLGDFNTIRLPHGKQVRATFRGAGVQPRQAPRLGRHGAKKSHSPGQTEIIFDHGLTVIAEVQKALAAARDHLIPISSR